MRLLLAEDDASLGETIQSWLRLDGYAVDWATTGGQARAALDSHVYDLLLLDRGLPGESGDSLLATLRKRRSLPVLIISARDTVGDRITGLDLGADDYLVKPFDLEELSARIRAALRRFQGSGSNALHYQELSLDPGSKQVSLASRPVTLTAREFAVLHVLIRRPGCVISRHQIEDALYGWGEEVESNAIEVYIYNLRRKLGASLIHTVRGLGYRLGT